MTKQVMKIALPGHNATSDTNPDHFALYVDTTDTLSKVLIKEKTRNTVTVPASTVQTIAHGLGYVPMVFVTANIAGDQWTQIVGESNLNAWIDLDTTNLYIHNFYSYAVTYKYYIFYDKIL